MTVDEIMVWIKGGTWGRTRSEGVALPWDEALVAEIERLRAENADLAATLRLLRENPP